jgi:hypothetical protein
MQAQHVRKIHRINFTHSLNFIHSLMQAQHVRKIHRINFTHFLMQAQHVVSTWTAIGLVAEESFSRTTVQRVDPAGREFPFSF